MIIESGVIIFFGMLLLGIKLPRRTSLKLLGRPLALDLGVSVLAYILHYGTFSGIMAAADVKPEHIRPATAAAMIPENVP
jgi:hypothetical protein